MKGTVATEANRRRLRQGYDAANAQAPGCQFAVDSLVVRGVNSGDHQRAFTGRGSLRELRRCVDKLAEIEGEMGKLSQWSKLLFDVGAYLTVHRRTTTGLVQLRWRERGGAKRHLLGQDVQALAANRSESAQRTFEQFDEMAADFNAAHAQARDALRVCYAAVTRRRVPLLPRRIA